MKLRSVLIIGYVWVEPNSSAAGSRMLQLLEQFLKSGDKITFASPAQKSEKAIDLSTKGINEVTIELNKSSFDAYVKEMNPDIVVFDRFMMEEQFGWRIAENCPNAIRILDTEDLHSLRKVRQEKIKKDAFFEIDDLLTSDIAKREIASILRCDLSLIISSFEMKLLKEVFKIDESILLHLPFLLDAIDEKQKMQWLPFEERAHFVFIGNFFHAPNVDAVLQLKKNWPSIRKQLPKSEAHIYGAYATQQIDQLHKPKAGFIIKGFAEDAIEVVRKAKVLLAPIRFGAGIKGKLTEAMTCGTPSVTTKIGAEGMHEGLPWSGVVVNSLEEFAEKSVAVYKNETLWKTSQENGVVIIHELYNKERLGELFLNTINNIQENLEYHRKQNFLGSLLQRETIQATKYMSKWIEEKNKG